MSDPQPTSDDRRPLSEEQAEQLAAHAGGAAGRALPLEATLDALAEDAGDSRLAGVARALAARLRSGHSLEDALEEEARALPARWRSAILMVGRSGRMPEAFEMFYRDKLTMRRLQRLSRQALAYPLAVVLLVTPILLLLASWIAPMFREIFEEFQLALPAVTVAVLAICEATPIVLLVCVVAVVQVWLLLRLAGAGPAMDRVKGALPVFGRIRTARSQWEFASTLANLFELGLPAEQALRVAGDAVADRFVARGCRVAAERVSAGESLGAALGRSACFDRLTAALAGWGETRGAAPHALRMASGYFAERVQQQSSHVRRLLPPLLLFTVGGAAAVFAGAIFLPLTKLIQGLAW